MNYKFKIEEWLTRFPLEEEYGHFSAENITSPWDFCQNEHLRREMQGEFKWGPAVPVDIFVMAEGEPEDRRVTKIGGLPYRPAAAGWPTGPGGEPLVFLAQFDFGDSKDLTGALPGDVLLVFADSARMPTSLHFEWQRLGLRGLVSPAGVPRHPDAFDPCYGHVFRTVSFPRAERRDRSSKYPQCRGKDVWHSHFLLQYQATQIGRAPFFIQQGDDELPGRLLCTISSVQPDHFRPYPWVNRPEPLHARGTWAFDDKHLMIGDMGCVYISLDEDGQLYWGTSCF